MELLPGDVDRLKKALLIATGLVGVGVTVRYIRDHEGSDKGFIYRLNKGTDWKIGAYRNEEKTEIIQVAGGIGSDLAIELDKPVISPDDVGIIEEVVALAKTQNPQTD